MKELVQSLRFKVQGSKRDVTLNLFQSLAFSLMAFAFCLPAYSQPKEISSSELLHRIEGLKTVASVLYIAAHPDDENTRLISYLEKGKHYRVAYLSLTRGEGGQNLIGDEQGIDLGILRTQELLAARKIDGGEQFFSTAYDFGYSKTPEETMKKWGKEKIVNDVINVMNHFQPDIVICRFPTTGEGGHGHHTASAMIAEEAFDSLQKIKEGYIPEKLFWNTFNFGNNNTTREDQLKIDVGGYNALLGKSYGEIAAEARSMHRCQAFGSERRRGEQFEYFKILRGDTSKLDLMDGIVTDWSRFKGGEVINKKIDAIVKAFDVKNPSKSVKALLELKKQIIVLLKQEKNISTLLNKKFEEVDKLILDCCGIYFELTSKHPILRYGDSLELKFQFVNRSNLKVEATNVDNYVWGNILSHDTARILPSNRVITFTNKYGLLSTTSYLGNAYPVYDKMLGIDSLSLYYNAFSDKFTPNHLFPEVRFESEIYLSFKIMEEDVWTWSNIKYKYIDPSFGEIFQPLTVVNTNIDSGKFVHKQIKYDHIPTQIYYTKPDPVLNLDYAKTVQKKIAYISGAGDKIPDILSQMGYEVTLLTESNISTFQLSNFSTIITGVRAYNTEKWLNDNKDKFLKYVEEGGNLLLQYNTSSGLVAEIPKPFPFKISRDRVTEEESEVIMLDSTSMILNYPNDITKSDFKNWIQEYGLYFPTEVDTNYKKILSMHDSNESPNENSTIYCKYGKGKYVYTGLSFFRELPAGVPGAVKLFINLMEDNSFPKMEIIRIPNVVGTKDFPTQDEVVPKEIRKEKKKK